MKSLKIVFWFVILIRCAELQAQNGWFQIQTGTNADMKSIKFVNNLTGFVCSESGKIFKTTDGGFSWQMKYDDANTPLRSIFFINENTGWAGGGKYSFDLSALFILKTINGGESWTTVYHFGNFYYTISNLYFLNDQTGFATSFGGTGSGTVGLFLKTTNGGSNWTWLNTSAASYGSIHFFDDQTGFITGKLFNDTGGDTGYIFKTINSGINWNVSYQKERSTFNSISFPIPDKGFVSGSINFNTPVILNTTDFGNIWEIDSSFSGFTLFETAFPSVNTGYVISSNSIFKTSNSGSNWSQQNVNSNTFNSLFFLNDNTGWIAGNNGVIFKTYTGGEILPLDTLSPKYFPLKVGNSYTYLKTEIPLPHTKIKATITKDTLIQNKKYFFANNFPMYGNSWIRVDSITGNLYRYNVNVPCNTYEEIIDSLGSQLNDTTHSCSQSWGNYFIVCGSDTTVSLFDSIHTREKSFREDHLLMLGRKYAKNIGPFFFSSAEPPPNSVTHSLLGCVIDGIVYGDTTLFETYSISGIVRDSVTNLPVSSGKVKALKYDPVGDSIVTIAITGINSNGTYSLTGIPKDSVDIMAYQDDELDFVPTFYPSTIFWENSVTLYPTSNLNDINIRVHPVQINTGSSYNIAGTVYKNVVDNSSLKDAYIYFKLGSVFYRSTVSLYNGEFHLSNVPAGQSTIIVNRFGYITTNKNLTVTANIDSLIFLLDPILKIKATYSNIPQFYILKQNYPNPFNPSTKINFAIPKQSFVSLKVYDIMGKEVATLVNENLNTGFYEYQFTTDEYQLPSGVYFYRLESNEFREVRRMILIR